MAAAKGNKYAEKWTEETALEFIGKVMDESAKKDVYYLGGALANLNSYSDVWRHLKEKFKGNEKVLRPIKAIEQRFEAKLYDGALSGKHVPSVAIFGLKNNHGWVDKSEVENSGTQTVEVIKRVIGAKPKK